MNTEQSKLSRIEKLKLKQKQLTAQIQKEEARHKTSKRNQDTRRKILLGAWYLEKMKDNGIEAIKNELNEFLKRNSDRALFGLPPLETETS